MQLINGTALAATSRAELHAALLRSGLTPHLAVLLVGHDPASALYVRLKQKAAEELGIRVTVEHLTEMTNDDALVALIQDWNEDDDIDGILVQLPLPAYHDEQKVIDAMDPKKDADGFHPANLGALYHGEAFVIPPVHEGILRLIAQTPAHINGAQVVIIGNSDIFSKPLERLLTTAGAHVTRLHADQLEHAASKEQLAAAHIVISAVGSPNLIQPAQVRDDCVLIDVGTTKLADGKIAGDVARAAFTDTDCWITPVPGGVGPMTIAQLLWNVYRLAERKKLDLQMVRGVFTQT